MVMAIICTTFIFFLATILYVKIASDWEEHINERNQTKQKEKEKEKEDTK